jgi:hypothetical protein
VLLVSRSCWWVGAVAGLVAFVVAACMGPLDPGSHTTSPETAAPVSSALSAASPPSPVVAVDARATPFHLLYAPAGPEDGSADGSHDMACPGTEPCGENDTPSARP